MNAFEGRVDGQISSSKSGGNSERASASACLPRGGCWKAWRGSAMSRKALFFAQRDRVRHLVRQQVRQLSFSPCQALDRFGKRSKSIPHRFLGSPLIHGASLSADTEAEIDGWQTSHCFLTVSQLERYSV